MNRITISLIFLIMISMILPASAIMYASGSTDNSDSSDSGSTDNSDSSDSGSTDDNSDSSDSGSTDDNSDSSDSGSTDDNSDSSDSGSTDDNSDSSDSGSTDDNAGLSTTFTENNPIFPGEFPVNNNTGIINNTGNVQPPVNNNTGIINNTGNVQPPVNNNTGIINNTGNVQPPVNNNTGIINNTGNVQPPVNNNTGIINNTGNVQPPVNNNTGIINNTGNVQPPVNNNTGNVQGEDLVNSILTVHNQERAAVGVQPLTWSDTLAASAQAWAQNLATTGNFAHDPNAPRGVGENIAGFNPSMGVGQGQSLWVNEKKDWHGGVLTPENWSQTGHYTQMVWKNTQEVGCGIGSGDGHPFNILVCRYSPAGNFMGQAPF